MYAISEEQQIALYVLWGIFRGMNSFSGLDIAFDKSKNGDSIEDIVAQCMCDSKQNFFARFCGADEIEVWSEDSPILSDVIKAKVLEAIPDAAYVEMNGRHRWKSQKIKDWFDAQYRMMYE